MKSHQLTISVQLSDKVNDAYFAKEKKAAHASAEEEFFADGKPKAKEALASDKVDEQKSVDAGVLAGVKKTAHLEKYLKSSWGLSKGQFPHEVSLADYASARGRY
jgi:large subunit ribosomal protein L6e